MTTSSPTIASYTLLNELGSGGSGVVWRALDAEGQEVAIKVQAPREHRNDELSGEAWSVARLDHAHIVSVRETGLLEQELEGMPRGSAYLVMDYVPAGTLAGSRVANFASVFEITAQLLDALAHAHSRNVVHLDIKPGNVLIKDPIRPFVVLSDFGISLRFTYDQLSSAADRPTVGTPAYMSPEQIRGDHAHFGPWTDIYSLGCVVHELCCGELPFAGENPIEVMQAHIDAERRPFRPRFAVPDELEEWLGIAMAPAFGQRFQRAADAAWALLQLTPSEAFEEAIDAPVLVERAGPLIQTAQTITWRPADLRGPQFHTSLRDGVAELPPLPTDWRPGMNTFSNDESSARVEAVRDRIWMSMRRAFERNTLEVVVLELPDLDEGRHLVARTCERALELGFGTYLAAKERPGKLDPIDRMYANFFRVFQLPHASAASAHVRDLGRALNGLGPEPLLRPEDIESMQAWACAAHADAPALAPKNRFELLTRTLRSLRRTPIVDLHGTDDSDACLQFAEHLLAAEQLWAGHGCIVVVSTRDGAAASKRLGGAPVLRPFATTSA